MFSEGKLTGVGRRGQIPPGRQLLRQAFYSAPSQLFVLFWNPSGRLECCELTESAVVPIAAFRLPLKDPSQVVVRCLDEVLHILGPHEGLGLRPPVQAAGARGPGVLPQGRLRTEVSRLTGRTSFR